MNTPLLNSLLNGKFRECSDNMLWFDAIRQAVAGFEDANRYEHGNTAVSETTGARTILEGVLQMAGRGNFRCAECGAYWNCDDNKCEIDNCVNG